MTYSTSLQHFPQIWLNTQCAHSTPNLPDPVQFGCTIQPHNSVVQFSATIQTIFYKAHTGGRTTLLYGRRSAIPRHFLEAILI